MYYGVPLFMLITKSNPDRMKYANFEVKILSISFENYRSSDGRLVVLTTGSIFANLRMKYHVKYTLVRHYSLYKSSFQSGSSYTNTAFLRVIISASFYEERMIARTWLETLSSMQTFLLAAFHTHGNRCQ